MLFILYGGHTGMGNAGRNFFRQNGVSIVKKYHYCEESPELTTFYESRNYVDKLTFYENTDPMYRYRIGNIQTGFSRLQIIDAVSGKGDYLLTLSTDNLGIIRDLKFTYKDAVQVIYAYTDDTTLEKIFSNMDISKEELELRCSIGRMIKACYRGEPSLFDYTIVYGGEDSPFDVENMVNQYNTFYIKSLTSKESTYEALLMYVQEIRRKVTKTDQTVSEMNETLKTLVDFFRNGLQGWLQHEKQWFSRTANNEDDESLIAASVARTNYYINEHVRNADSLISKEAERLQNVFGAVWDRLPSDTRTALISAGVLWTSCVGINDPVFDYSGICVATTSALENALKSVFYIGYQTYLLKTYGPLDKMKTADIYKHWPEELLDTKKYIADEIIRDGGKPEIKPGNYFTMGTLPHLFYKKKKASVRKEMEEYLRTILKKPENAPEDWVAIDMLDLFIDDERDPNSFVSRCEHIRNVYRNPAAHSGIVVRTTAEDCTDAIVGRVG